MSEPKKRDRLSQARETKLRIAEFICAAGILTSLCAGCAAGCARSHFGTGGMAIRPGEGPMDNPKYVGLLRLEKERRSVQAGAVVVAAAAGAYIFLATRSVKRQPPLLPDRH